MDGTTENPEKQDHWFTRFTQQLSVVTVIIIIAGGLLTCLLLFIFAKRQIMRFALRSHRGPHVPFGTDANKTLRKEILRRIDCLQKITYEPKVLREDTIKGNDDGSRLSHYYRMKAVDDSKSLEQSIVMRKFGKRQLHESLRSYLMGILTPQMDPRIVHQFCDLYEAARFNPKPFTETEYIILTQLLKDLRSNVQTLQSKNSVKSPPKSSNLSSATKNNESDEKSIPYLRKTSKDKRRRWSFTKSQTEEEPLCEISNFGINHGTIKSSGGVTSTIV